MDQGNTRAGPAVPQTAGLPPNGRELGDVSSVGSPGPLTEALPGVLRGAGNVAQEAPGLQRAQRGLGFGLVVLATVAWSTGGYFITVIARGSQITSPGLAFWRVFCTFLLLLGGLLVLRPRWLRVARRDLPWLAGMGALAMGSFQALWMASVLINGLSVATVIQCNAPVMVTLLAWVFWRESLTWRKWVAIALAFAGTALIAWPTAQSNIQITALGLLIALGSALAYGAITLFAKKLTGHYNSWTILVYAFGFASLALLPFQFGRALPAAITGQAWAAFAGLLLITTIAGYVLYATALKHLQASVASIVAMTEVPLAAFWGYVLLGERMDVLQILGAIAVVGGVVLLSLKHRQPEAPNPVANPVNPV